MFGAIKALSARVNSIDQDDLLAKTLSNSSIEGEIVRLNQDQLNQGLNASGEPFMPQGYAPLTLQIKAEKGQQLSPPNLKDTGDFQSNIYVQSAPDSVIVKDSDRKTEMLQTRYGANILGVKEKLPELRAFTLPFIIKDLKAAIFRK